MVAARVLEARAVRRASSSLALSTTFDFGFEFWIGRSTIEIGVNKIVKL